MLYAVGAGTGRTGWARDERVLWRAAPGLVVVLGPHAKEPISLRGSAVPLWATLDRPQNVADVVERLAPAFSADPDIIRADIEPVIARLAQVGALRRAP
jgi:Coenzyme PQQ synthesis protein D (PqqD)